MLDSSEFIFEPYNDKRVVNRPGFTVGISGPLLLAVHKETGRKYLVKHTYPHNAANEYVACWLAERLGVPAPKAYLLSPNEAFATKYAVAIEYIEGFRGFQKDNVPENLKSDLIAQFALSLVLRLDDMIQMSRMDDHIYSYDFSEAFNVIDLKTVIRVNDDAAVDQMRPQLQQFKRFTETEDFNVPGLAKEFHLEPGQLKDGMISTIKRAIGITNKDLDALTDELMEMYSAAIAVYYEECIRAIRHKATTLTEAISENEE